MVNFSKYLLLLKLAGDQKIISRHCGDKEPMVSGRNNCGKVTINAVKGELCECMADLCNGASSTFIKFGIIIGMIFMLILNQKLM